MNCRFQISTADWSLSSETQIHLLILSHLWVIPLVYFGAVLGEDVFMLLEEADKVRYARRCYFWKWREGELI